MASLAGMIPWLPISSSGPSRHADWPANPNQHREALCEGRMPRHDGATGDADLLDARLTIEAPTPRQLLTNLLGDPEATSPVLQSFLSGL